MLARILLGTLAAVGAHLVHTYPSVLAGQGALGTFIDILLAGLTVEEGGAGTDVVGLEGGAMPAVGTGVRSTGVCLLALLTWRRQTLIL